jgi:putative DNA methylase
LNPVAVLINKAMVEIPPRFSGAQPVNPGAQADQARWSRQSIAAQGLADDVRYYGKWMRDEAEKRIGGIYPKVKITSEIVNKRPDLKPYLGKEITIIAWLWARTVKSPNPAFANVDVPLASTFWLSTKVGREAYVDPVVENGSYHFNVRVGKPRDLGETGAGTKLARGANFRCIVSGAPISADYIKAEGMAGRMGARLMAMVADTEGGRVYLAPTTEQENAVLGLAPEWKPDLTISGSTQYLGVKPYGMERFDQLFTDRQLLALNTFSDLVSEARQHVLNDATNARLPDDSRMLNEGGRGAPAYAEAIAMYLAFGLSKALDRNTTLCTWEHRMDRMGHTFTRQALPMTWDFVETNPLAGAGGDIYGTVQSLCEVLDKLYTGTPGYAIQSDARTPNGAVVKVVSTDPPYYDNVPYADLSDFFYVWLRRSLRSTFPQMFATLAVPKSEELVAFAYRHGGKEQAEQFFLNGMTEAMKRIAEWAHPSFPITLYYAFKQTEHDTEVGSSSTGWETFLGAAIAAGFEISGTWPIRTELLTRTRGMGSNALASSIVLVCRRQNGAALVATRREFATALKSELPTALRHLQSGNIAPVDLAQSAIGPGMAIFTRYAKVIDAEGKALNVRDALALINQVLDEVLAQQEGDFDPESRFAIAWFEQMGFAAGEFGIADVLARAKNTAVSALVEAGIVESRAGKVRLLSPDELKLELSRRARSTVWGDTHQVIRAHSTGGESAAAQLIATLGSEAHVVRELAYRLYTVAERKKRASDALSYNALVQSWPEIARLSRNGGAEFNQGDLFEGE